MHNLCIFLQILHLHMEIDIWYKFHGHTPSSLGGGTNILFKNIFYLQITIDEYTLSKFQVVQITASLLT